LFEVDSADLGCSVGEGRLESQPTASIVASPHSQAADRGAREGIFDFP